MVGRRMSLAALILVLVSWTPAIVDLAGNPLPFDETWTYVTQWLGICPGSDLLDGRAVWNGTGTTQMQFVEVTGPYCYKVNTLIFPDDWHVSQPVLVGNTSGTCGNQCHSDPH
jgi:hypothetical protein